MADEEERQIDEGATAGKAKEGGGDTLQDASDEAVREMEERAEGTGHAGAGDIG